MQIQNHVAVVEKGLTSIKDHIQHSRKLAMWVTAEKGSRKAFSWKLADIKSEI
jgi:hypothetical protein